MSGRFNLEFAGREYTVEQGKRPEAAAEGGGAPAGRDRWYITLGPKAVTSLEVLPGEGEAALHDRVRRWLAEHPEMPASEDIVLGGG